MFELPPASIRHSIFSGSVQALSGRWRFLGSSSCGLPRGHEHRLEIERIEAHRIPWDE